MFRRVAGCLSLFCFLSICVAAQTQPTPVSDPKAISIAQQAVLALTGGVSISDVTLNANVISIYGSDNETGTGTFSAKGVAESRIDLDLSGGTRSDVRTAAGTGGWKENSAAMVPYAGHNCRTDAAWFFPALSALSQTANPSFVFEYIGQEEHASVSTQHIRVLQLFAGDPAGVLQRISAEDFYLDSGSGVPDAIAFKSHPDNDFHTDIATEVRFANYQKLSGVQIPFHFQEMTNGSVVLDATVTTAAVNTGLSDNLFNLQ